MLMLALAFAGAQQASATANAGPQGQVFALVVGNNAGGAVLPDLAYADDDALRMADVLEQTGADVELLTRPDDDTAGNDGPRAATPPTRASWDAAVARIAAKRARAVGATTFFLYFAGHGDAERGTGSLLLEDGRLLHADLRAAVDAIAATTTHIVLDACNAFFVVHGRGASGRSWATPDSAGQALSSPVSNVGLFLSTSAEAQVFEWSQLQGGVFSHALRSGLRGAADADLDGLVTYLELEAFVRTATEDITNALYVPQLFARAAAGSDVLLDLGNAPRQPLSDPSGAARLTVRDAGGTILVDVRPEAGFVPRVLLPEGSLLLEVVDAQGRRSERMLAEPSTSLAVAARGPAPLLGRLFTAGWGPAALAAFHRRPAPDQVFGLSASQEQRLLLHLRTMRDAARDQRQVSSWSSAAASAAVGVGFGASALGFAVSDEPASAIFLGVTAAGAGGLAVLQALGTFSPASTTERTADELLATAPSADEATAVRTARMVRALDTIQGAAKDGPGTRTLGGAVALGTAAVAVGLGAVAFTWPEFVGPKDSEGSIRTQGGGLILLGGLVACLGVIAALQPTDAERLDALMRADPESVSF